MDERRYQALKLAHETASKDGPTPPAEVVARAEVYLGFLAAADSREEGTEDSYLRNCIVIGREGEGPIFFGRNHPEPGIVLAHLDGYLVVPRETPLSRIAAILGDRSD